MNEELKKCPFNVDYCEVEATLQAEIVEIKKQRDEALQENHRLREELKKANKIFATCPTSTCPHNLKSLADELVEVLRVSESSLTVVTKAIRNTLTKYHKLTEAK